MTKIPNPTSRDIADLAGVSQATVSRALRGSPLVRPETRERIQEIARDLNYFVNRNAAGLRTHHSNTIALLLFDENEGEDAEINPFFLSMLGCIAKSAATLGYDVLVSIQQSSDDWHVEYQASNRADGIILLGYGDYMTYREKLTALADANTRFMIWGPLLKNQPGHTIGCDNINGGYQATRHLIRLGRKNIAFLGDTSRGNPEQADRHKGYRSALFGGGANVNEQLCVYADNREILGREAVENLLRSNHEFDAIFAATDVIAIGAIRALQENGISVPDDISVVGFDDLPMASQVTPKLTTVQQDTREAGEGLVQGIVSLIEGNPVESTLMAPTLIIRESCGGGP